MKVLFLLLILGVLNLTQNNIVPLLKTEWCDAKLVENCTSIIDKAIDVCELKKTRNYLCIKN